VNYDHLFLLRIVSCQLSLALGDIRL
jgi:hypothetical protein